MMPNAKLSGAQAFTKLKQRGKCMNTDNFHNVHMACAPVERRVMLEWT